MSLCRRLAAMVAFVLTLASAPALADRGACERWMPEAERRYGLPAGLLEAVAHVESAWRGSPWPWTLNIDGEAVYAPDRRSALRAMTTSRGEMHVDMAVGCMQIFVRYHGDRFETPAQMLDPRNNVHYAAYFLRKLFNRHQSWTLAVKHYHASDRKPSAQRRYACRVLHYQIRLGHGRLTPSVRAFCSGDYARALDVAHLGR